MQKQRLQIMVDWGHYVFLKEIMEENPKIRNESGAIYQVIDEFQNQNARIARITLEYKRLEEKYKNLEYELRMAAKKTVDKEELKNE